MAQRVAYSAIRDLVVSQLAYAIGGRKIDEAEALILLGDVVDELQVEHGVEFATGDLTNLVSRLAIKAQEVA